MPRVKHAANADTVRFAREQRREPTRGEMMLWEALRGGCLGVRFRRQHPFDAFVLDFYCDAARLAVEVDGPAHEERRVYDQWRDERLLTQGIRTLRLPAELVETDLGRAVEMILEAVRRG
jgi:very-short-patch-repair endonuclease